MFYYLLLIELSLFYAFKNGSLQDYCYNGYCGSRDAQCQHIWGPTGRNAAPACYDLNLYGSSGGNCGFLHETNRFVPCAKKFGFVICVI